MLADDQAMVRGALAALLALETDIEVVAQAGNGDDVLPVALEHRPDVVLMDVDMPGTDGLSATARLLERLATPGGPGAGGFHNINHIYKYSIFY